MGFNVSCSPGPDAAVAFMKVTSELPALVMYLDPVNLAIQLPAGIGGHQLLAQFCRELSREAALLAEEIDPGGSAPRHLLAEDAGGDVR